mgnify:CR=1 FL=1
MTMRFANLAVAKGKVAASQRHGWSKALSLYAAMGRRAVATGGVGASPTQPVDRSPSTNPAPAGRRSWLRSACGAGGREHAEVTTKQNAYLASTFVLADVRCHVSMKNSEMVLAAWIDKRAMRASTGMGALPLP